MRFFMSPLLLKFWDDSDKSMILHRSSVHLRADDCYEQEVGWSDTGGMDWLETTSWVDQRIILGLGGE